MIIGLVGNIGSGKSLVAQELARLGAGVLSADIIAREVVEPGKEAWRQIKTSFGAEYFLPDQTLDRRKLGATVFADEQKRQLLNSITIPQIMKEAAVQSRTLAKQGKQIVILEAPILLDLGLQGDVDEVWLVETTYERQLNFVMTRDSLSKEEADNRISSQMSPAEQQKYCTQIIVNDGTIEELYLKVRNLWEKYQNK